MRAEGLRGVVRGRRVRTTVPALLAQRRRDLLERALRAERPNQLWVADVTCVDRAVQDRGDPLGAAESPPRRAHGERIEKLNELRQLLSALFGDNVTAAQEWLHESVPFL